MQNECSTHRVGDQHVHVERGERVVKDPGGAAQDVGHEQVLVDRDAVTRQLPARHGRTHP